MKPEIVRLRERLAVERQRVEVLRRAVKSANAERRKLAAELNAKGAADMHKLAGELDRRGTYDALAKELRAATGRADGAQEEVMRLNDANARLTGELERYKSLSAAVGLHDECNATNTRLTLVVTRAERIARFLRRLDATMDAMERDNFQEYLMENGMDAEYVAAVADAVEIDHAAALAASDKQTNCNLPIVRSGALELPPVVDEAVPGPGPGTAVGAVPRTADAGE